MANRFSMADFREKYPDTAVTTTISAWDFIGTTVDVNFLFATNPIDGRRVIRTCCRLIAETEVVSDSQLREQLCSYHLSIRCNFFPALEQTVIEELRDRGSIPIKQVLPSFQTAVGLETETDDDLRVCLIVVAQAIYLLYKTVDNHVSYNDAIIKLINTLKARLCLDCGTEDLKAFRYEHAHLLRAVSGSCQSLKAGVINQLINNRVGHGHLNVMCDYMCGILEWTDMGGLKVIKDELIATKSPVLRDKRVASEVMKLGRAFKLINADEYPQYYRIRKPGPETIHLQRAKFPALIAVAEQLKRERNGNVVNYVTSMNVRDTFVTELVNIHKARNAGGRPL